MESWIESFLHQSITFAAIMDPVGVSAMMLGMLPHQATHSAVARIARQSTVTVTVAFFVVLFGGDMILRFFGIDQSSLKVIGGLVLLMMAIEMLGSGHGENTPQAGEEIGVIPLGIPIIFGAGLFTTIIIFKQQADTPRELAVTVAAFLVNVLVVYLALRYAIVLRKWLGKTGEDVVTKLMGLITGAIAAQFIVGGVVALARRYWGS